MSRLESIALIATIVSFCASTLYQVWRISDAVAGMRHNLEKQDIRLENLNDVQALSFNGFKEKIEHFITRSRNESKELDDRLKSVENFLTKTTEFEKR